MNKPEGESAAPVEVPRSEATQRGAATAATSPGLTPLYEAFNASRYERRMLIREIQVLTGRPLIAYVAGTSAQLDRDDALGFVDLLQSIPGDSNLDLLLHTPGGDIDAAEKLVNLLRSRVGTGLLRIVVPDFAKSAGTLMALAANTIMMSDASELGPIDPQVVRRDRNGNALRYSVLHYIEAYDTAREELSKNPSSVAASIMLGNMDPETVKLFRAVRERAKTCAEQFLLRYMFNRVATPPNWTQMANELTSNQKWLTHGQVISAVDARDSGLLVEVVAPTLPLWALIWRLYCRQRMALANTRDKVFESESVFLSLDGGGGEAARQGGGSDASCDRAKPPSRDTPSDGSLEGGRCPH